MTKPFTQEDVRRILGEDDPVVIEACFHIFEHEGLIIKQEDGTYVLTPKGLARDKF